MIRLILWLMVGVLASVEVFAAAPMCDTYRARLNVFNWGSLWTGYHTSRAAACSALASETVGRGGFIHGSQRSVTAATGSMIGDTCSVEVSWTGTSEKNTYSAGMQGGSQVECPPDPCAHLVGIRGEGGGTGNWHGNELCRSEDAGGGPAPVSCRVKRAGTGINFGDGWFGHIEFTGESCGSTGSEVEVDSDPPNCVTGPKGQVCISKTEKNCGVFDGETVCLDEVPAGRCVLLAAGGAVCDGSEGSDAGPKDEEGDLLEPSQLVELVDSEGNATDMKFFPSETVSQGVGGVAGVGTAAATGEGVKGPGAGHSVGVDGDGNSEFGGDPDGESWDSEGAMGGVLAGIASKGWYGVIGGTASALSGAATCPSVVVDIDFIDASFDLFGAACAYIEPHYGLWTLLMQVAWGLLAMRIFWTGVRS